MTVVATNKCHITTIALEETSKLFYKVTCKNNSLSILENYIASLSCPDLPLEICSPDDICNNIPIIFNCNFNIIRSTLAINNNLLTFTINTSDYVGGTSPFTYVWDFEEDDFEPAGPINNESIVLVLRPLKDLSQLVSRVAITITDSNGCQDIKVCWLNKGVLKCSTNFIPCANPRNLRLVNLIVTCAAPSNLIILQ